MMAKKNRQQIEDDVALGRLHFGDDGFEEYVANQRLARGADLEMLGPEHVPGHDPVRYVSSDGTWVASEGYDSEGTNGEKKPWWKR